VTAVKHVLNKINPAITVDPIIFAVTRLTSSLLFGLSPTDPVSLVAAALAMLVVGLVAGYLPSRRATRVDPMVTLRCE
jgi:ABC-type antimicrobial peptide transport system permease subunit